MSKDSRARPERNHSGWQGDFMLQGVACAATCLAIQTPKGCCAIASEGRCGAERPSTRTWHPSTQVDDQP
jgi:hypothetical protein